jgi:uncharacterized membrane protein YkoI
MTAPPLHIVLLAAAMLAGAAAPAAASGSAGYRGAPTMLAQAGDIGPAAAAAAARRATGGTVLGVQGGQSGGRVIYRVKVLLPGGRVRTLSVDGASGQVLG